MRRIAVLLLLLSAGAPAWADVDTVIMALLEQSARNCGEHNGVMYAVGKEIPALEGRFLLRMQNQYGLDEAQLLALRSRWAEGEALGIRKLGPNPPRSEKEMTPAQRRDLATIIATAKKACDLQE